MGWRLPIGSCLTVEQNPKREPRNAVRIVAVSDTVCAQKPQRLVSVSEGLSS